TVADLDDAADFLEIDLGLEARQLPLDDLADLARFDHSCSFVATARLRLEPWVRCSRSVVRFLAPLESLLQPCELAVQAAVHDDAADLGDEAAEQGLIPDFLQPHLLAAPGPSPPRCRTPAPRRGPRPR